jgi:hypothetical protein
MPYPLLGNATKLAAAKAWAKLMMHEKQQREKEAEALSSSF